MTAKVLTRLELDHERFAAILGAARALLSGADLSDPVVIDKLSCIVDYVAEYPDALHHPWEDRLFERLTAHDLEPQAAADVARNLAKHADLGSATQSLKQRVLASKGDLSSLRADFDAFIHMQFEHMNFEQDRLFPLAREVLSEEDWSALDAAYDELVDPLFDSSENRFEAIFEYVAPDKDYGQAPTGRGGVAAVTRNPAMGDNNPAAAWQASLAGETEMLSQLGDIALQQWSLYWNDVHHSMNQLVTQPWPMVAADHWWRRTTHTVQGLQSAWQLMQAELHRQQRSQRRRLRAS